MKIKSELKSKSIAVLSLHSSVFSFIFELKDAAVAIINAAKVALERRTLLRSGVCPVALRPHIAPLDGLNGRGQTPPQG